MKVKEALKYDIGIAERASPNHPYELQDAHFILPNRGIFGVIDGLGSSPDPIAAAHTAKRLIKNSMQKLPDDADTTPKDLATEMRQTILNITGDVRAAGGRATVVICKLWEGPKDDKLIVAGFGHERPSRYARGRLTPLTLDDGLMDLVLAGELKEDDAWQVQHGFSRASNMDDVPGWVRPYAPDYLHKVRYALGDNADVIEPHIQTAIVDFPSGGILLIPSDGVNTKGARDQSIEAEILRHPHATNKKLAELIVNLRPDAIGRGSDDKTLLVVSKM